MFSQWMFTTNFVIYKCSCRDLFWSLKDKKLTTFYGEFLAQEVFAGQMENLVFIQSFLLLLLIRYVLQLVRI